MVRKRHRYLTVEVHKEDGWRQTSTRAAALMQALNGSIRNLYGVQGIALSKAGLHVEFLGPEAELARVSMRRSAYKIVASSLQLVTVVDGGKATVRSLHSAATRRHATLFAEKYIHRQIESRLAAATSEVERANLRILIGGNTSKGVKKDKKNTGGSKLLPIGKTKSVKSKKSKLKLLADILS